MALETVWLSVITYGSVATQVRPLTELGSFIVPELEQGGSAAMGEALKLLLDCYNREVITKDQGGDFKPLVFMYTDGHPTDDWEKIADEIGAKIRTKKIFESFVALGVGSDADISVLKRITDDAYIMHELSSDNVKKFFEWVSQIIMEGAKYAEHGPLLSGRLPPPPPGIELVL